MPNNPKPLLLNQGGVPVYPVTDASLVMNIATASGIFWAEYGTTTAAQIDAAVAAGKAVLCNYSNQLYVVSHYDSSSNSIWFGGVYLTNLIYLRLMRSNNAWSSGVSGVQVAIDRVQTLSGNESETTKYPSTAATYDAIHPAVVTTQPAGGFVPNVVYDLGELTGTVTFALATPSDATIANAYYWTFSTGSTAPTITWPANLSWAGGSAPTIAENKKYEIMIRNGCASALEF